MSLIGTSNANEDRRPPTPKPFLQCMAMPPNSTKAVLDAWNGYHSVPLRELTNTLRDRIEEKKRTRNPAVANNNKESKEWQKKTSDQTTIAKTCTTGRN